MGVGEWVESSDRAGQGRQQEEHQHHHHHHQQQQQEQQQEQQYLEVQGKPGQET